MSQEDVREKSGHILKNMATTTSTLKERLSIAYVELLSMKVNDWFGNFSDLVEEELRNDVNKMFSNESYFTIGDLSDANLLRMAEDVTSILLRLLTSSHIPRKEDF